MKLIKQSFEILEQKDFSLIGIKKFIERCGRVCYKSEDKITEDSAKPFVDRMIKSGHGAILEFGTIYLYTDYKYPNFGKMIDRYTHNKYSKCNYFPTFPNRAYISSNLRVLVENGWLDDLKYLCEPTEFHERRITVRFVCDRGVSHEFVRHRVFSFAQESTRYCNYSKDKFGNELTFIKPCWCDAKEERYWLSEDNSICSTSYPNMIFGGIPNTPFSFLYNLLESEKDYFILLKEGWKPQEARAVLPNALKTELVMTGFVSDWQHFFRLRCDKAAHPQARELAIPLQEKFKELSYVNQ